MEVFPETARSFFINFSRPQGGHHGTVSDFPRQAFLRSGWGEVRSVARWQGRCRRSSLRSRILSVCPEGLATRRHGRTPAGGSDPAGHQEDPLVFRGLQISEGRKEEVLFRSALGGGRAHDRRRLPGAPDRPRHRG